MHTLEANVKLHNPRTKTTRRKVCVPERNKNNAKNSSHYILHVMHKGCMFFIRFNIEHLKCYLGVCLMDGVGCDMMILAEESCGKIVDACNRITGQEEERDLGPEAMAGSCRR